MSDTNDMRREFEWLAKTHDLDLTPDDCDEGFYNSGRTDLAWIFWQAATERATAQSDSKDAARYRWLRDQDWFSGSLCVLRDPKRVLTSSVGLGADCPSGTRLDTAIDEAIRQGGAT